MADADTPIDYGASSYASRLTPRNEKGGGLGLPEKEENQFVVCKKIIKLAELIRTAKSCVVLTGAGISTSAGVSDFRGPNGVWTAEKKGVPPPASKSFENVQPTLTHMALVGLVKAGFVDLIISQNVDGLHLRSELPRNKLAELHGNLFVETCEVCGWEYLRDFDVGGISFSKTGRVCTRTGCGGCLRNSLLDWEDALPEKEFQVAEDALRQSDLCICMGTSLRIRPASELPLLAVKKGGKLILVNLQKTPKDKHAYMRIQAPVDDVIRGVMAVLGVPVPIFTRSLSLLLVAARHTPLQNSSEYESASVKVESAKEPIAAHEVKDIGDELNGEAAHQSSATTSTTDEGISDEHGKGRASACGKMLWNVRLQSPVGRRCHLPLISRVIWSCGSGAGREHSSDENPSAGCVSSPLSSVVVMECTREGGPGMLCAEVFLTDSCSFQSKCVEVCEDRWVLEKGCEGPVEEGEWYSKVNLPVVHLDNNTRPQPAIVQELEDLAKLAPESKRKHQEGAEAGPAVKKSPWRKCGTCGKTGRVTACGSGSIESQEQEWFCRRRCRLEAGRPVAPEAIADLT